MKAIVSLRELCWRIDCPVERLREIVSDIGSHYRVWQEYDRFKDKVRTYKAPKKELKEIQRRIVRNVLAEYELSDAAHGAVKGRSPRTNAEAHLGQCTLANVDAVNFFPEVCYRQIFRMFRRDFGFGTDVSWLLTKLTTFQGGLPQGAPTSPAVANALLTVLVDRRLELRAKQLGVTYTRFVDDLTFSGENARMLINEAAVALSGLGLRIWRKKKKLKITRNHARQIVTGLVVNSKNGASVGRARIEQIKAAIHKLPALPKVEQERAIRSIQGRISHVRQFNEGAAARLSKRFDAATMMVRSFEVNDLWRQQIR